jgi:hypothetical protein
LKTENKRKIDGKREKKKRNLEGTRNGVRNRRKRKREARNKRKRKEKETSNRI